MLVVAAAGIYLVVTQRSKVPETAQFSDPQIGLSFTYRQEPDGYILVPSPDASKALGAPVREMSLFLKSDYEDLQNAQGPREGPPGMHVQVFNPGPNITPEEWALRNLQWSNYQSGTPHEWMFVDGSSALRYSWSGLYNGQTVIVARKGWVYVFAVTYDEPGSRIADLDELLASVDLQ